jgi:hypothetical protein
MKDFRYNKDGSHWSIWSGKNYFKIGDDWEFVDFYPFPTLKFSYHEETYETEEYDFNIEFIWLFWKIYITKYWGKAYKEQMEQMKMLKG